MQRRWGEPCQACKRFGTDGMAALYLLAHRKRDLVQPHGRRRLPHWQIHKTGCDPVTDPAGLISVVLMGVIHADGNHRPHGRSVVHGFATSKQPGAQRSRDRRKNHVVDCHLVRIVAQRQATAHRAVIGQIRADNDIAPCLPDLGVEGTGRGRANGSSCHC